MSDDTPKKAPKLRGPKVPCTYTLLVPIERTKNGQPDGHVETVEVKRRPRFKDGKLIRAAHDGFDRLAVTLKRITDMTNQAVIDELDISDVNGLNELLGPFFETSDGEDSSEGSSDDTSSDASDT